jgi:hypothetical protein
MAWGSGSARGLPVPSSAFCSTRAAAVSESTHAEHLADAIRFEPVGTVAATQRAGRTAGRRHPLPRCRRWWRPARPAAFRSGAGEVATVPEGHRLPSSLSALDRNQPPASADARAAAIAEWRWCRHARVLRLRPRAVAEGRRRGSTRRVGRWAGPGRPGLGVRGLLRRWVHPSSERGIDRSGPGPQWPGDRAVWACGHGGVVDRGAAAILRAVWRSRRELS